PGRRERIPVRYQHHRGAGRHGGARAQGVRRSGTLARVHGRRNAPGLRLGAIRGPVSRGLSPGVGGARGRPIAGMDFVLVLHSHLPYVLNHGRWPHGSDWLCEAALETYLPLYDRLSSLAQDGIPAPVTLGITPVLANQLASTEFAVELERFIEHRLALAREAASSVVETGDGELLPLVKFWEGHLG